MNDTTPYANLDPNVILSAIESLGFICTGSLLALNSYENRVYQVGIEDAAPLIAKFYRPGRWSNETILEEHQFAQELIEHDIPVVAPWRSEAGVSLHHHETHRFALFPRWGGWALEVDRMEQLAWMGRFIGRMHAVSACRPFEHRPTLTVETYGHKPYQFLIEEHFIPEHIKANYCHTVDALLEKIEQRFAQVGQLNYIRLHGDMHAGNALWNDTGPHIVDLDDCLMGPAIQDIWMLLSGDQHEMNAQLQHILHGYEAFHDFDFRERHLIEALRSLRMLHYAGWLAKRWEDPAFPSSFPWFNTPAYWQDQVIALRDQLEALEVFP